LVSIEIRKKEGIMSPFKKTENLHADIVVIGGGGAGLTAAVSAAEAGAKNIIVLEKSTRPGGNTFLAVGMMAVESPAQKRLGIKTSKDQVFKEAMEFAKWTVNPKVVRAYINKSGELIGWFESKGINLEVQKKGPYLEGPALGHGFSERQGRYASKPMKTAAEGPGMVGSTVVEAMLRECEKLGIKVLTKTKAEKLLTDGKGQIRGVLALTKDKDKEYKISAKSVIIAAGDFGGNAEMMAKYFNINIRGDVFHHAVLGMTGDGILMARDVGAAIDENPPIHWFGPCHHKWASSVHFLMTRPNMLWVNRNGERFIDEATDGFQAVYALHMQPGQICYALVDSKIIQDVKAAPLPENVEFDQLHMFDTLYEDLDRESAEGKKAWKANTLDEFTKLFGAKLEALKATVERYNSFCDKGYDADFVKDPKYLQPLRTPPYYAILGVIGYAYTSGGIKINERMEVLNKEGEIISGLYAAGNSSGGWISQNATHGGTTLTYAFCSGYIAGENAAKYALGKG
jgi:fumarate reductase flavoprotein subunit